MLCRCRLTRWINLLISLRIAPSCSPLLASLSYSKRARSPVCPLLVQHTMTALLAPYGIAALDDDLCIAVTAGVLYRPVRVFRADVGGHAEGIA